MKKIFNHIEKQYPVIERTELQGLRHYKVREGVYYPSVTTVISETSDDSGLEAWRNRIGREKAQKITDDAAKKGEAVHAMSEDYLYNKPWKRTEYSEFEISQFFPIKIALDKHVDNIYGLEKYLFSDYLKVAGSVDCIAEYDGKLSIIDFKTARSDKKEEWINGYKMQVAAYAVMFEEITGIGISQGILLISSERSPLSVIKVKRNEWIYKFMECRKNFERMQNEKSSE